MGDNLQNQKKTRKRFGPILWPLLLIGIGLMLLLDSLGLLGRNAWEILWNLWPVLFIAIGLDTLFRKKEIFGPVFWIGLGTVFLLSNFGMLGWNSWNTLLRLWPLILVTAGLEILLGKRSVWLSLLVTAALLSIIIIPLGLTSIKIPTQSTLKTTINESIGVADKAGISISLGIGELKVFSLEGTNQLITGEISLEESQIHSSLVTNGNTIYYSIEQINPLTVHFDRSWLWVLGLTKQIPIILNTSMGLGSMDLSIDKIDLEELKISQGIGEINVNLSDREFSADISQAVGQIIVVIPKDTPIQLEINRGVSGLFLPSDFEQNKNLYYTPVPVARSIDQFTKIKINQAVGSIVVSYDK